MPASDISVVLAAANQGDREAAERLLPLVYEDLRRLARSKLQQEARGHTLQATALVHEAWLRVVGGDDPGWDGRAHFFESAAQAMRRILVDAARRRNAAKRAGRHERVDLDDAAEHLRIEPPSDQVLDVDTALDELEQSDERKARIVKLRYFAGLSNEETAQVLGVSVGTVERDWRFIRARLKLRLSSSLDTGV